MPKYKSTFKTLRGERFPPLNVNAKVDDRGVFRVYYRGKGPIDGAKLVKAPIWEGEGKGNGKIRRPVVVQGIVDAPQAWWDQYYAMKWDRTVPGEDEKDRVIQGTWEHLWNRFQATRHWETKVGKSARKNHRTSANQILPLMGAVKVKQTRPERIEQMIQKKEVGYKKADGTVVPPAPMGARGLRQTFLQLGDLAVKLGWIVKNPVADIEKPRTANPKGHRTWSVEEVEKARATYPIANEDGTGNLTRRLVELGVAWGPRAGDLVRLGWQDIKDGILTFTPAKTRISTGAEVHLNATAQNTNNGEYLAQVLALCPKSERYFFMKEPRGSNQYRKGRVVDLHPQPRSYNWVEEQMKTIRAEAGLHPKCTSHGLRKHFATLMADRDVPLTQIASALGDTEASALIYVKERDKRRASLLATGGIPVAA
jgi:integrase